VSNFLYFFGLLAFLFLISKALSKHLGLLIFRLTRHNHTLTVRLMAAVFLPGTIVHEFAHASVAQFMGVPVGDIELMPVIEGNYVKLGSVKVADTDPFRRFLIGMAPVFVGLILIFTVLIMFQRFGEDWPLWAVFLVYYAIFEVGNGMFSSRRDMEGAIELFVAVAIVIGILYFFGVRFSFDWTAGAINNLSGFFSFAAGALLKIVVLDLGVIIVAYFLNRISGSRRS